MLHTLVVRCHSGELYYVFGMMPAGWLYRDAQDLPFMQHMLDVWSCGPSLRAHLTRTPTRASSLRAGSRASPSSSRRAALPKWERVTRENLGRSPMQLLQWESEMVSWGKQAQWEFLGFPPTYFG